MKKSKSPHASSRFANTISGIFSPSAPAISPATNSVINALLPWPAPRNFITYIKLSLASAIAGKQPPSRSGVISCNINCSDRWLIQLHETNYYRSFKVKSFCNLLSQASSFRLKRITDVNYSRWKWRIPKPILRKLFNADYC